MKNQITVKITQNEICGWKVLILTNEQEITWHSTGPHHTAQLIAKNLEKILTHKDARAALDKDKGK